MRLVADLSDLLSPRKADVGEGGRTCEMEDPLVMNLAMMTPSKESKPRLTNDPVGRQ